MDGILAISKTVGITSYDVIRQVKKMLPRGVKIGHAGTLDPFASGVLLILLGKATKQFDEIQTWKKTYRAVARLGAKSDTLDSTGIISEQKGGERNFATQRSDLCNTTKRFVGEIEQIVPAYAAAKYQGRKLYEYAREGVIIPEKKKIVTVYSIEVLGVTDNEFEMRVVCSSGTYIRQLSYDIMQTLGIESYLSVLEREAIGEITLENCAQLNELTDVGKVEQRLLPVHGA
ncbi:MAG: tRNA pseudouridine(55) synthase TruB [bacterium]